MTGSAVAEPGVDTPGYNLVGVWSGTNSYNVNDVVSYGNSLYINILATSPLVTTTNTGGLTNLFDQSAIADAQVVVERSGALAGIGGFQSSGYVNVAGATSFITNIQLYSFDPYGLAFYDANKNYVGGSFLNGNGVFPAGSPVAVPAGAAYVRFWWQAGGMGTTPGAAILDAGSKLQSTYTPYGVATGGTSTTTTIPSALPTDASHWSVFTGGVTTTTVVTSPATTGPWAGKKMFMLGDSIVSNNPGVAAQIASMIGAVPSSQGATAPGVDASPGRSFDMFTNGQNSSGSLVPLSASILADVDLLVVALGTNQDSGLGIGSATDAPSLSGTLSAQMRAMLETIMGWKPGMRVIVVGPYQSNRYYTPAGIDGLRGTWYGGVPFANAASLDVLRNINNAMKAVCNLYAVPYVDMYNESGVNFSSFPIWLIDGLHPSGVGYNTFYAPYLAAQLNRIGP